MPSSYCDRKPWRQETAGNGNWAPWLALGRYMGTQHYYSVSSRTKASPDQKEVDRKRRGARVKCEIKTLKEGKGKLQGAHLSITGKEKIVYALGTPLATDPWRKLLKATQKDSTCESQSYTLLQAFVFIGKCQIKGRIHGKIQQDKVSIKDAIKSKRDKFHSPLSTLQISYFVGMTDKQKYHEWLPHPALIQILSHGREERVRLTETKCRLINTKKVRL